MLNNVIDNMASEEFQKDGNAFAKGEEVHLDRLVDLSGNDYLLSDKHHPSPKIEDGMTLLPIDYLPSQYDVIVGTGREAKKHVGNINFKHNIATKYIHLYSRKSKSEKGRIISQIIDEMKNRSPRRAPFVKKMGGHWFAVGYGLAREKVSQSLRNELHEKYRSSGKAKKLQRMERCQEIDRIVYKMMKERGSYISERINLLKGEIVKKGKNLSEDEVTAMFTQANIDNLEFLKHKTIGIARMA